MMFVNLQKYDNASDEMKNLMKTTYQSYTY